mmetsp:Transcript_58467/g.117388  ORF Transcript_58467/g.117388 Transcript_58467/m.117388 type:complete len:515 (+) Transcript_58467:70-1614(+)
MMGTTGRLWSNWWASPSLGLACGATLILALCIALPVAHSMALAVWFAAEVCWWFVVKLRFIPRLVNFRPEDASVPMSRQSFVTAIDNVVFLLKKDAPTFWLRVTGTRLAQVPRSVGRGLLKSLLFVSQGDFSSEAMLEEGLRRLEIECAAFSDVADCAVGSDEHCSPLPPNLIQGWVDDEHLESIVRSTPLVVSAASLASSWVTATVLRAFGWQEGPTHEASGVRCWVLRPPAASLPSAPPPPSLVLLPGAGNGLLSFMPLALLFQRRLPGTTIVLFRLSHVEVGRPWTPLPQWSDIVAGLLEGLRELEVRHCDVVAHSYGTAVANRLLRELCLDRRHSSSKALGSDGEDAAESLPVIGFLGLIDPITLGGATTGLVGIINQQGPDLSFAFCANRAGVTQKEIMDFDPTLAGQCLGRPLASTSCRGAGVRVFLSEGDVLLDVPLARSILNRFVPGAVLEVDSRPKSFHGCWLVELWMGGQWLWEAPGASRCIGLMLHGLGHAPKLDTQITKVVN